MCIMSVPNSYPLYPSCTYTIFFHPVSDNSGHTFATSSPPSPLTFSTTATITVVTPSLDSTPLSPPYPHPQPWRYPQPGRYASPASVIYIESLSTLPPEPTEPPQPPKSVQRITIPAPGRNSDRHSTDSPPSPAKIPNSFPAKSSPPPKIPRTPEEKGRETLTCPHLAERPPTFAQQGHRSRAPPFSATAASPLRRAPARLETPLTAPLPAANPRPDTLAGSEPTWTPDLTPPRLSAVAASSGGLSMSPPNLGVRRASTVPPPLVRPRRHH
ncbi:uncharacterized protein M6B38_389040 [Iris pallida]|uniref:Uncharacterized protein n=1 Tax=Iris pallida TaxID=29817 RepID=A0AAX6G0X2_IRIPA|nr:uncharacterized protein M6B38_389040 [Iris pallida]